MPNPVGLIFPRNNFVDICIYQFGHQHCDPLHGFGPALRNNFLFHYILSGKGELDSKDESGQNHIYKLEAGQGFMIWPKQENTYCADKNDPWEYCWIEFGGLKSQEFVTQAGLTFNHPVYNAKDENEARKMKAAMLYMFDNMNAPILELMGQCYLFLSSLIVSSASRNESKVGSLQNFYTREIINYIGQNFHSDITVEDISAFLNLDRSHVNKIFKSNMGTTLRDFLLKYRINKACDLMRTTHQTIGEISLLVGYANTFNFSRAFKAVMGESPRQWRLHSK
ncbi:MAG: AraC family transcriptional regulator [Defluviitaleaceae bacterium]|nr:AraC family transcriptional regulator [Defluviitaleaceae bacterium]MCL2240745.1 AraC family transcriptional regulator [Defluviitaleaceae bacterium]